MAVLLITYDLNKEVKRPPLLQTIKSLYPDWAKLSESSYAVNTQTTPQQVYNSLAHLLDSNDSCLVITLKSPWWGRSQHPEVIEWLKQRL